MSADKKTLVERIKDNLSGIVPVLMVLGYLDIHFYYGRFGINIYPYLDVTEIMFAFAGMLVVTIPMLFYIGVLSVEVTEEGGLSIKQKRVVYFLLTVCILSLIGFVSAWCGAIGTNGLWESFYIATWFLAMVGVFWFINTIIDGKIKKGLEKIHLTIKMIFFLFAFILFLYGLNIIKARKVKEGDPKFIVELVRSDTASIKSDTILVFIGASKNYFFLRKNSTNENHIIPRSQVIKLIEKRRRIGL